MNTEGLSLNLIPFGAIYLPFGSLVSHAALIAITADGYAACRSDVT